MMTPEEGYREAERRISQAQKSRNRELNLCRLNLTDIPPQIAEFSQLRLLYLRNNQIIK
jgi:Leucine-rich repeat (LRR) protein